MDLIDKSGNPLRAVPIEPGTRADMVAEFAFWGAKFLHDNGHEVESLLDQPEIMQEASRMAFDVVQKYEGAKPDAIEPLSPSELRQGLALTKNYAALYRSYLPTKYIEFSPEFQGCGFLNAAEGDLGIDETLVEIKTTTRRISGKDLRQLITYLALDAAAGRQRWSHVAIFNPRRGTFHRAEIDALILRISGGKPRVDVLGEVVEFVQITDFMNDRIF